MTGTYDPDLLVTFLAVAETGSFSEAARRRNLRQSTVSQQVRRLEAETRRRLFDRDTHDVSLTVDGQALTVLAGEILAAYSRAERYFSNAELRGRVRFGASEDFALSSLLPQVLRAFSSQAPSSRHRDDGRARRRPLFRHGRGRARPHFRQAAGGRRARPHRVARGDGLDRGARLAARPASARCRSSSIRRAASPARRFSRRSRRRMSPGASPAPAARFPAWSAPFWAGSASARNRRVSRRKARSPSVPRRGCRRSARRNSSSCPRSAGRARRSRRWPTPSSSSAALFMPAPRRGLELHRKERSSARSADRPRREQDKPRSRPYVYAHDRNAPG